MRNHNCSQPTDDPGASVRQPRTIASRNRRLPANGGDIRAPFRRQEDFTSGANMQVTEARIYPTDEDIVRAYVTIAFDNWLMIRQIKVIRSTTAPFRLDACQKAERRHP
jgi:hypothetical protein